MIVVSFSTAIQIVAVLVLFGLWYLRALETAHRLEEMREEMRALRLAITGGQLAPVVHANPALGTREIAPPPPSRPLPRDELLALGRSLAFQLLRGERTASSLSTVEQQAVREYHALPDLEKEFPAIVVRHTKAT